MLAMQLVVLLIVWLAALLVAAPAHADETPVTLDSTRVLAPTQASNRAPGQLRVTLLVQPDCSIVMPVAGQPFSSLRIGCSDSVAWLGNITDRVAESESFVTLQFAAADAAGSAPDAKPAALSRPSRPPAFFGAMGLRFNLDY
jgi:hypothetical protein